MPTSIPRLCRSIPSVYLPTRLENTSPSAQASVAGIRFAMGPPCQLRFRGFAAPSQSRAFASLWGRRAQLRFRGFAAPSQSRAFASRWGRRANFDSAALPLHLSRGRSLRYGAAVRNFDSAALPLHLSRGHSPYGKTETGTRKNASTLPGPCFRFSARLIAVTKALTSLYITDNKFLLILTDPHGFLSR